MGKDSHSKQSKGSNNAKLPSFIAQDSKANNLFYHHHSVLQWFPEPWSFMHLDIVHAMLVILSEVLLFFQYFVLFGSSFLNCNWRQYVVSSLLLVTEAIYVITPKEYFSPQEIEIWKPLSSIGIFSPKNLMQLFFSAALFMSCYEPNMTFAKWLNLILLVAITNCGTIIETIMRALELNGPNSFPIYKKLKSECACSFGMIYIIGSPLLTLFKYLYYIHFALYLSSANLLWMSQLYPTIIHFNTLEIYLSVYCSIILLSPLIFLHHIERYKMNIFLIIERSIQQTLALIHNEHPSNFSVVVRLFEQTLLLPCMYLLKSIWCSKKCGLHSKKLFTFSTLWALINIVIILIFAAVSQRLLISQIVLLLITLLFSTISLIVMPEVLSVQIQSRKLQATQGSLSVNPLFDVKHGSKIFREHQTFLTQTVETVSEQKLSTDTFADRQFKSIHQVMWLRLKNTNIFNNGGVRFSNNVVGTTSSTAKRLRRKSR